MPKTMLPAVVAVAMTLLTASLVLTSAGRALAASLIAAAGVVVWGLGAGFAAGDVVLPALVAGLVVPLPALRLDRTRSRGASESLKNTAD